MSGRLIAVVGPSGVGKDSVMSGIAAACPAIGVVRRTITRPADLGGEAFDAVSDETFETMRAAGAFCLSWSAHGLSYGLPIALAARVAAGGEVLANLSRGVLAEAAAAFPGLIVLELTASPDILARRL
ncbi:MAG: phosphonate metabolism protein/1,5-bisphosphokinase (PRPP-forming) PhnN, partial [Rhodobacteraceae bacterium]